ncbi:phage tail protein [Halotia branconii]|uniref:Phage tail protein n=1 Tax=Halotia branconii CENA392 TaxID=1539056 RepID=A0AAJ6PBM6_9CYAN|nr:phage tail protein [Halotia branconii]WGV28005.1 phage tail protein [Halotia branconii CENA392]
MSEKEFQFLVLNTKADWQKCKPDNLQISDEGLRLKTGYQLVFDQQIFSQQSFSNLKTADLAVDDFGQLYLLDTKQQRIWLFDTVQNNLQLVASLAGLLDFPTKIAFSNSTIYVVNEYPVTENTIQSCIYAFSRFNWQIRWVVELPEGMKVIDLAADTKDGTLYALLDRGGQVVAKYAPSGQRIETTRFARGNIIKPTAIALENDTVYVLDCLKDYEKVVRFDANSHSTWINFRSLREQGLVPEEIEPSGLAIDSQGSVYVGDKRSLPQGEEEDRFIFRCSPSEETVEPVFAYRGAVSKMIYNRTDKLFIFNSENKVVSVLRRQQQFLRQQQELPSGSFKTVFDSTIPNQQWHKLILEREIPHNTQIKVYYSITDNQWQPEAYFAPLINPEDALILGDEEIPRPQGRYLHLKVELIGTEYETPLLKSIRVDFPRLSYLRYLPAIYQEDENSRDFLERFLSLFETFFGNLEGQIDHIVRYFDADVVNGEFLPWLSTWLAIAVDDNWTKEQLRNLMKKAPQLYQLRGTREGIAATVELFTGDRPLIYEYFQVEDNSTNNQTAEILQQLRKKYFNDNELFRFWVLLSPFQIDNEIELQSIQRLIDADKPAHTEASIKVLQPWIALDNESYLGFNSCIFEPSLSLDMGFTISHENVLNDSEEFGQIERRSRLGLDTKLN